MLRQASEVRLTKRQKLVLDRWVRNPAGTPHRLLERCRIVLMSAEGMNNIQQGLRLGIDRQRIRRWRTRWVAHEARLVAAEVQGVNDKELAALLTEILGDEPRPGGPPKFTAEELAQLIAIACESPDDSGRPVTHWTPGELAGELIKRGIVTSISRRHVGRILKKASFGHTRAATG